MDKQEIFRMGKELNDIAYAHTTKDDIGMSWICLYNYLQYSHCYSEEFRNAIYKEVERVYKDYKENYKLVEKEEHIHVRKYVILERIN